MGGTTSNQVPELQIYFAMWGFFLPRNIKYMSGFFEGLTINGILLLNEQDKLIADSVVGVVLPGENIGDVVGYQNILKKLRADRERKTVFEALEQATASLALRETVHWERMQNSPHVVQKYVISVSAEIGFKAGIARKKTEELGVAQFNTASALENYFNIAFGVETVVESLKKLYQPTTIIKPLSHVIDTNTKQMDYGLGDLAHMYTRLNVCYDRLILPQFGISRG